MTFCRQYQVRKLRGDLSLTEFADLTQVGELDPELMHAVLEALRKWEAKYGPIVAATHRDKDLKRQRYENVNSAEYEDSYNPIKAHPYLNSPRFDGVDPNVNPNPQVNVNSEEALRNELTNVPRPGQRPKFDPRPGWGG